ncbi:MAG: type IV secretion system protein, partial [Parascardovia denticolens]
AVKPVAMTILAIVFTLEIIKVSKHVDETGDRGVRMIVSALIKIIIIYMAAMNAEWLCQLITYLIQQIGTGVSKIITTPSGGFHPMRLFDSKGKAVQLGSFMKPKIQSAGTFSKIMGYVVLLIPFLVSVAIGIIVKILVLLRFFELIIMTAFGALPISFLSYEGTKSWGEGYIRTYASCAFSNITLLIAIGIYGSMQQSLLNINSSTTFDQLISTNFGGLLASSFLLGGLVVISQKAAKALFGQG